MPESCTSRMRLATRLLAPLLLLVLASSVLAPGALAENSDLPDYPRVHLNHIRSDSHDGNTAGTATGENVLAVGMIREETNENGEKVSWLVEPNHGCCSYYEVAVRLAGNGVQLVESDKQVAVYGQLEKTRPAPGPKAFTALILDGWLLRAERLAPAEQLVKRDNIVELLDSETLSFFFRAVVEAGLYDVLKEQEGMTIFAPIDQAFVDLGEDRLKALFDESGQEELREWVLGHVTPHTLASSEFHELDSIRTMSHQTHAVSVHNGSPQVADSRFLWKDMRGSNGTAHIVSGFLVVCPQPNDGDGQVLPH